MSVHGALNEALYAVYRTRVAISCRRDHIQASVRVCGVASLLDNKGVEDLIN